MKKKSLLLCIIIIIPILAALLGFYLGNKQSISSTTLKESESTTESKDDNIITEPFSEVETILREIVRNTVGNNNTVLVFKYTKEKKLYVTTEFTRLNSDLSKTLKLIKQVEETLPTEVNQYYISFKENSHNKMLELDFNRETLNNMDLSKVKSSDLLNLATNKFLDQTLSS